MDNEHSIKREILQYKATLDAIYERAELGAIEDELLFGKCAQFIFVDGSCHQVEPHMAALYHEFKKAGIIP